MDGVSRAGAVAEGTLGGQPGAFMRRWTGRSRGDDPAGTRSFSEVQLDAALASGRCPICAYTVGDADHWMRYFAIEGHSEREVLEEFRLGPFCATHGSYAVTRNDMPRPLCGVQSYALRVGLRCDVPSKITDRRFGAGADPGCPACRSLRASTARCVFFLASLLRGSLRGGRYPYSGLICQTHLTPLIPRLSDRMLRLVLATAASRIAAASPPEDRTGGVAALEPMLRLTVGEAPFPPAWPRPGDVPSRQPGEPAKDLLRDIVDVPACPICQEMARVMTHWTGRLAETADTQPITDLLPTCREHVWALVHAGPPALAHRAAAEIRRHHLGRLRLALAKFPAEAHDSSLRGWTAWWRRWRDGSPSGLSRAWLLRAPRCPFCDRLEIAETETLSLLGAVLRLRPNRDLFDNGFGLCLRHAARFAQVCTDEAVRAHVRRSQDAKLAVLGWELDVCARKNAWQWRPDAKGSEMAAPLAAVLRLSGGTFTRAQRGN